MQSKPTVLVSNSMDMNETGKKSSKSSSSSADGEETKIVCKPLQDISKVRLTFIICLLCKDVEIHRFHMSP